MKLAKVKIAGTYLAAVLVASSCSNFAAAQGPALGGNAGQSVADASVVPVSFEGPRFPDSVRTALDGEIDEVRQSGILKTALGRGDKAVDFELPLANGANLRLSELWAVGPVVLVYYRGGWCPLCNSHLQRLQKALLDIHRADAQLVAISPETPTHGLVTQQRDRLTFPILSDKGNQVARRYGIVYRASSQMIPYYNDMFDIQDYNGDRSYELPLAATYVIDRGGVIRYAFLDVVYAAGSDATDVVAAVRRLKGTASERPEAGTTAAR